MLPSEIFYRISHGVCVRWRLHQNIQASCLPYVIHVFRADLLGTVCHLIQHQILEIGVGIWHLTSALSAETNVFFPVVGLKGLWGWLPPKHKTHCVYLGGNESSQHVWENTLGGALNGKTGRELRIMPQRTVPKDHKKICSCEKFLTNWFNREKSNSILNQMKSWQL